MPNGWNGRERWAKTWDEATCATVGAGKPAPRLPTQVQLAFEICIEQRLQHLLQAFIRPRSINSRFARSNPSSGPSSAMGCVFTQRTKRAMPSSSGTLGEKPNAARWPKYPQNCGGYRPTDTGPTPLIGAWIRKLPLRFRAMVSTLICTPDPTFIVKPSPPSDSSPSAIASVTSDTCTKSRLS